MLANFNFGLLGINAGLLFMEVLLLATSVFLMLLILVQRGKGGGLTGALGGMGGQSAFGSKAGDAFTKITVVTAVIWIMLCMLTIAVYNPPPRTATVVPERVEAGEDAGEGSMTGSDTESMSDSSNETEDEVEDKGFQLDLDGPEDVTNDSAESSDSESNPDTESAAPESDADGN